MTIQRRAYLFSSLIILVLASLFALNRYQQGLYASLLQTVQLLDRVKHIAHRMELDTLVQRADRSDLQRQIQEVPLLFGRLAATRGARFQAVDGGLVGLGLAFIRLERLANIILLSRSGVAAPPLLEQLHNEVEKIEQAVAALQGQVQVVVNAKRRRIQVLEQALYPLAFVLVLLFLAAILRTTLHPVLSVSRQVQEVSAGRRVLIDPPLRDDEIGRLARFINEALHALTRQRQSLEVKQRQMEEILRKQEAISQILRLQLATATTEELLEGTLDILLSLEWLTIESKGGIFLVDPDDATRLRLAAHRNFPPSIAGLCSTIPIGHCLCGRAAAERRLVYAPRCAAGHTVTYPGMGEHGHYCVPILFGATLLGVMVFYLAPGHEQQEEETRFLDDVANLLAEAVSRRQMEELQRLVSSAVDQAGEGIVVSDGRGRIRYANLCVTALAGCDQDELYQNDLRRLLSGLDDVQYAGMLAEVNAGRTWRAEVPVCAPDGRRFVDQLTVSSIVHPERSTVHYLVVWEDVSDAHQLRQQLMRSQRLESLGRFTSGIVHDFNNIVSTISGFSQIGIQELPPGEPAREHFCAIADASRRAAALIRQLLAFSRQQPLELRRFDLCLLVKDLGTMLQRLLGSRIGLQVETRCDEVMVSGDPGQLEQVVMNLVANGRDAMPDGGRITIVVGVEELCGPTSPLPPGRYAVLRVTDTGPGIPEAIRDKIFDPFFTTKKEGEGTGLGLSTVYGIVRQHHGHVQVASPPGQGATFTVHLPLASGNGDRTEGSQAAAPG